jgi:hypothetical protein
LGTAWANNLGSPISKITREKYIGGVAKAVKYLLALNSNLCPTKKKKKSPQSLGVMVHTCNPSSTEDEAGVSRV